MARSPLFTWLRGISREAGKIKTPSTPIENNALTRRDFLKGALGATLGAATLIGMLPEVDASRLLMPAPRQGAKPVVIVGGGLAGLTTAYRLTQHNVPCVLYEASPRLGGRVFSKTHFNAQNMFVELGGELVDTVHTDLIALCQELNVPLERFEANLQGMEPAIYHNRRTCRTGAEVVNAFLPLANAIEEDLKKIFPDGEVQMPTYRQPFNALWADEMTLEEYLDTQQARHRIEPWLIDLIKVAYTIEYGLDCSEQSALNLILLIGTDLQEGFRMFGDSDEAMRIQGGNSQLVSQLATALQGKVPMHAHHKLLDVAQSGNDIRLSFSHGGKPLSVDADYVVLAAPLTVLRDMDNLMQLPLSPVKKRFIRELGYGTNSKQMIGFKGRFWRNAGNPVPPCAGEIYSDWPSQSYWETSRLQTGSAGILTNFLGGKAGKKAQSTQWQKSLKDLSQLFPEVQKQFDGNTAFFNWTNNPLAQGSYTCPKPGQYTSLIGAGLEPELNGKLHFAGEHCSTDWMGFMNGAVDSGNQTAQTLLKAMSAPTPVAL